MKWFRNMKLKTKMLVSFSMVIALLAGMAVFATMQMKEVDDMNSYASHYPTERQIAILEIQGLTRELRRQSSAVVMYTPLGETERIAPLVEQGNAAFKC